MKKESATPGVPAALPEAPCGCPGSQVRDLKRPGKSECNETEEAAGPARSRLSNWPVQIRLAPVSAPFFERAKLLIAADCAPFAYADFHRRFMADKAVLIGCPKLDDAAFYQEKLKEIFRRNDIAEAEVVYLEVPCCFGLVRLASDAIRESGAPVPLRLTKLGIRGGLEEEQKLSGCESEVCG